jgi:preprotein translocase subunit YajC
MTALAYAQSGNSTAGPHPILQFLPLVLVFVVFYFLLIRPQQKKAKDRQLMIDQLKRNDEVLTSGGIYGRVVELHEKVVTLEIAPKVSIRVDRQHVESVVSVAKANKASGAE